MQWKSIARVAVVAVFSVVAVAAHAGGHHVLLTLSKDNLYDTAKEVGSFDTLVAAIDAADMVDTFRQEGPFTIWAPTDEAFAALPKGTLEALLKPENKSKLQALLKYHVVIGRINSQMVIAWTADGGSAATLEGSKISVSSADRQITINDAHVLKTDVQARNGIIHVIDAVLVPTGLGPLGD